MFFGSKIKEGKKRATQGEYGDIDGLFGNDHHRETRGLPFVTTPVQEALPRRIQPQDTICEDSRPQPSAAPQPRVGAGAESPVHPVARAAFLSTQEPHALDFKFNADKGVELHTAHQDIAARCLRARLGQR